MTRRSNVWWMALVCLVVSACGIPVDDSPEVIANAELPESLQPGTSTTTTLPPQLTEDVIIYLVDPGDGEPELRAVTRQVPVVDSGADIEFLVFEQLIAGPTSEEQLERNLTTLVVPTSDQPITVLGIRSAADGQLVIVLSEAPALEGEDRTVAFAQMVFTLTEIDGVETIRFLVRNEEGTDVDIPVKTDTDEGDVTRPVSRDDYSTLQPQLFVN